MINTTTDVFVLSGVRTANGKYGGGLAGVPPCDLASAVVGEAVRRAEVEPAAIGHWAFGNVIHTEARDMYLGRVAAQGAWPAAGADQPQRQRNLAGPSDRRDRSNLGGEGTL